MLLADTNEVTAALADMKRGERGGERDHHQKEEEGVVDREEQKRQQQQLRKTVRQKYT